MVCLETLLSEMVFQNGKLNQRSMPHYFISFYCSTTQSLKVTVHLREGVKLAQYFFTMYLNFICD